MQAFTTDLGGIDAEYWTRYRYKLDNRHTLALGHLAGHES